MQGNKELLHSEIKIFVVSSLNMALKGIAKINKTHDSELRGQEEAAVRDE